ncbi:MAG: nucleotidyltransferase [Acidobacteriia bacterium]|nr:nucleotidyltransferase [Terriglobia bacterium]
MALNHLAARTDALDLLLFNVCDTLQLSPTQHQKAEDRYHAITKVINAENSPFWLWDSKVYSQGSMRLRTTVKPIDTPHDLDLVCEFDVSHKDINPMVLLEGMYTLFSEHGVYGGMVTKRNRCVRIEYKDEFWLDILPACCDYHNGGACIQVPDRDHRFWRPSNPIDFADWFKRASRRIVVKFSDSRRELIVAEASVEPLPPLQTTEEKTMLQLIVQLLKRWRDVHYANSEYPPISIVLTTLAADLYTGEQSISTALLEILDGIVSRLDVAHAKGRRLAVPNPVHPAEDFSERWDTCPAAYLAFNDGIRKLATTWREVCETHGNPGKLAKGLFGRVIDDAILQGARMMQADRSGSLLGVASTGCIVPGAAAVVPMIRNTNHGAI